MAPSGAAMAGVLALAEDLIGNRLSRSVADINPYPAPAVPRRHMPELIAVIVIVRIIIVAVRSAEADRKPPEVMTMIEEMAMVEERTMVQTGDMHSSWPDMHSSWPKGTDSRWTRSTESRWTRSTDSHWRRSAEMRAAHGGTTALKTTAAEAAATVKAATAEATTAVAAATGEPATAEATAAVAAATGEPATAAVAAATATAEATTAVAAATTASLCKSIGRREGDANCRHCGKKKSDLSAHGTSPRIG